MNGLSDFVALEIDTGKHIDTHKDKDNGHGH
jgi:hypothetical protein